MNNSQLQSLLKKLIATPNETEWLEFKVNNFNPEEIGERISGIANSANLAHKDFGYLIFGVEDQSHKVVGTSFNPKKEKRGNEEVVHWLFQRLNPRLSFQIYEFTYETKNIVLIEIPAATDKPVSFQKEEWIRIGSITRKLKEFPEKERQIWQNLKRRTFEKEIAKQGASPDEVLNLLDYSKYFSLTDQPIPSEKSGFLEKMEQDGLISHNHNTFNITNLGAILFANDITKFDTLKRKSVRVIIYEGKDRVKRQKEQEGKKGYAVGFENLVEYIDDKLPSNEEIKKALREETKMYPKVAIREIVANSLIHQDFYEKGTGPMIEIFNDRIEVTNPGTPLISTDRFIDHPPKSRNEDLAAFMRRMKICEEGGTGIDRTILNIELFQLPAPKFECGDMFTKVTLYAHKSLRRMNKEDKIRACYQHCVLKYISNDYMTNTSLRKRFDIKKENYSTASRIISDAIKANVIKPYDPEQKKHAKYIPIWA